MDTSTHRHIDSPSIHRADWSKTSDDYAKYRAGFPSEFFSRLAARRLLAPGTDAVDLGTGTGLVAAALGARGVNVTAIDIAEGQLAHARLACRDLPVVVREASAEDTGLEDDSVDLAIAGTAWHWFDRDAAGAEVRRILRPGGHLVIATLDWLSREGNLIERSIELVRRHKKAKLSAIETLDDRGVHHHYLDDLFSAGFVDVECFGFDVDIAYTPEAWRGRMRASAYVGATLSPDGVAAFDADLAAMLEGEPLDEAGKMQVSHRVFAALGKQS